MLPQKKALDRQITKTEETTEYMLIENNKALTMDNKNKEGKNMLPQKKALGG